MNKLIKLIFRNEDFNDRKTRTKAGILTSSIGVLANIVLCLAKLAIGTSVGSVTITSDAFNNLADSASSVVAFIGYKIVNKPADRDHPFGHGRAEYLTSLFISGMIVFVGFELLQTSIGKVFNPTDVTFSWVAIIILLLSILIKVALALFNLKLGKLTDSTVMKACGQDSINDVVVTTVALFSLVLAQYVDIPIDGICGVIVSVFIMYSGVGIIKETTDYLMGKAVDRKIVDEIIEVINATPKILGVHDLILHSYGPTKIMGSAHVEVSSKSDIVVIHDQIDELERLIQSKYNIHITLHTDPVEEDNEVIASCRSMMNEMLNNIDSELTYHDLRVVSGRSHTNIIFDLVVPFNCKLKNDEIQTLIDKALKNKDIVYYTVITFDQGYYQGK